MDPFASDKTAVDNRLELPPIPKREPQLTRPSQNKNLDELPVMVRKSLGDPDLPEPVALTPPDFLDGPTKAVTPGLLLKNTDKILDYIARRLTGAGLSNYASHASEAVKSLPPTLRENALLTLSPRMGQFRKLDFAPRSKTNGMYFPNYEVNPNGGMTALVELPEAPSDGFRGVFAHETVGHHGNYDAGDVGRYLPFGLDWSIDGTSKTRSMLLDMLPEVPDLNKDVIRAEELINETHKKLPFDFDKLDDYTQSVVNDWLGLKSGVGFPDGAHGRMFGAPAHKVEELKAEVQPQLLESIINPNVMETFGDFGQKLKSQLETDMLKDPRLQLPDDVLILK